jgi:hypothetical protein
LKGWKSGLCVKFGQFPCPWIRIRIPKTDPDPDPGEQNQGGSMQIRIRNTVKKERNRALWLKMKQKERQLCKEKKDPKLIRKRKKNGETILFKILLDTVPSFLFGNTANQKQKMSIYK